MTEPITYEEWLAYLEASSRKRDASGETLKEIKSRLGFGINKTRELVRMGIERGWVERGFRDEMRIDGVQTYPRPVYRLKPGVSPSGDATGVSVGSGGGSSNG